MKKSLLIIVCMLLGSPVFAQNAPSENAADQNAPKRGTIAQQTVGGTWLGTVGTTFAYNSSSNELLDGTTSDNSNYLVRLELGFGNMIVNQLEVGIVGGVLLRRLARENDASATERDWLIQARTNYIVPVTGGLGLGIGAALGPYFGASSRDFQTTTGVVNETTSTFGVATDGNAGVVYGVSEHLQLRMMINLTWLYGTESISSANADLTVSTTNLGLALSLGYVF
jgi:hypothetical protein